MRNRLPGYRKGFRILSLALDEITRDDLTLEKVEFIYVQSDSIEIYPEKEILSQDEDCIRELRKYNNYDVLGISENGLVYRYYDDSSTENALFITEKCNSNCIMCPSPDYSRQRGEGMEISDLITIAGHIPSDTSHITVTGGEPFMAGKQIFELFAFCRQKFQDTEFLILTNGRIFAVKEYCDLLKKTIPAHCIIGIPIHGSIPEIHDRLTRSENSYAQTMLGLKRLQEYEIQIEIRIVVCKENLEDIERIADLIIRNFPRVHHVNIMAMEMTGNAHINADILWVPYKESFKYVKKGIDKLIASGIDVMLYNYPLCTVDRGYWMLCAKSISSWKIRFGEECGRCSVKESCGGVFAGSIKRESNELKAI